MGGQEVTLGIPCYNEGDVLSQTLSCVENQLGPVDRLIVLDDASTDNTAEIADSHPTAELIQHDVNRGRGATRNSILSATETPLLAMIDADIWPRKEWLFTLRDTMDQSEAAAVGGKVIEPIQTAADRWRDVRLGVNEYDDGGEVSHVAGGNVLFKTEALREVGGWPDLQSTEDKEVCFRLNDAGYTVYYTPDAEVKHVGEDTPQSVLRNLWRWHFESRNEPDSLGDLPFRFLHHTAKGAAYSIEDIFAGRWWALPITLRLPLTFLREDLSRID